MIKKHACVTATCDQCDEACWEEGAWHFESEESLVSWLKDAGWLIGDRLLCRGCATIADCTATGHQWDAWDEREMESVLYRHRDCDHCGKAETDPPFSQLCDLWHAAQVVNSIQIDDQPAGGDHR